MNEATRSAELFNTVTKDETKWSPYRQMVANVFNAHSTLALSVEQINQVANALYGLPKEASLQDALTFYVRAKVLRRRRAHGGRNLYEVNF